MIFNVPREEKEFGRLCCSVGLGPAVQGGNGKAEDYFCPFYFYWSTSCSVGLFNNQGQNSVPSFTPGTKCICNDLSLHLSLQKTSAWTWQEKHFCSCTYKGRPAFANGGQTAANGAERASRVPACVSWMSNTSWKAFAWKFKYCLDCITIFTLAAAEEHVSILEETVRPCRRRGALTVESTLPSWITCQRQLPHSTGYCSKLSVRLFLCRSNLFSWKSLISFPFIGTSGDIPYL